MIETPRIRLLPWSERHNAGFAALCADPEVMRDLGGPLGTMASRAKMAGYADAHARHGFCRWALETHAGAFLGYAGVMARPASHPLGAHFDIGWRLARHGWGFGYATEAARAALRDFFRHDQAEEVLAYTAPDNARSQAVMARLKLRRDPARDFTAADGARHWHGLVWVADRAAW